MTAATEAPASTFTAAKRGDVVIVAETITSYRAGLGECSTFESIGIGIVTSITREGMVKTWTPARGSQPQKVPSQARTYLVPKASVHVPAVLAMAATHSMSDLGYPGFYRTLDEVRADLRHCRITECTAWDAANAAERFRLASDAAWAAYREGERAAGIALRDAGYHTREGNAAHHAITRQAMHAHTAAMLAAAAQFRSAVPS